MRLGNRLERCALIQPDGPWLARLDLARLDLARLDLARFGLERGGWASDAQPGRQQGGCPGARRKVGHADHA